MLSKRVFLDGNLLEVEARTTREAALVAVARGVKMNVDDAFDRTQHIGEGPNAFFVLSRPGEVRPSFSRGFEG